MHYTSVINSSCQCPWLIVRNLYTLNGTFAKSTTTPCALSRYSSPTSNYYYFNFLTVHMCFTQDMLPMEIVTKCSIFLLRELSSILNCEYNSYLKSNYEVHSESFGTRLATTIQLQIHVCISEY